MNTKEWKIASPKPSEFWTPSAQPCRIPIVVKDGRLLEQAYQEMQEAQATVDQLYARWAELEKKIG